VFVAVPPSSLIARPSNIRPGNKSKKLVSTRTACRFSGSPDPVRRKSVDVWIADFSNTSLRCFQSS